MKTAFALACVFLTCAARAQHVTTNIPYAEPADARQVLDIHAPAGARKLPVVFWIHGGGWQTGDKTDVQEKPRAFADRGFVFVTTNYRLLPDVDMGTIIWYVPKSLGRVHRHIADYGGDPARIVVAGESAGGNLALGVAVANAYRRPEP